MQFPRARFTIGWLMIAVGIVAPVLAVEPVLFHHAAEEVRSGDADYIWGEAVTVWLILNILLSIPIGVVAAMIRGRMRYGAEAPDHSRRRLA
jgi:hypothetical protein